MAAGRIIFIATMASSVTALLFALLIFRTSGREISPVLTIAPETFAACKDNLNHTRELLSDAHQRFDDLAKSCKHYHQEAIEIGERCIVRLRQCREAK